MPTNAKPIPIVCRFPAAADEWKLADALIETGLNCSVARKRYAEIEVSPVPGNLFKPSSIRLFVKGYVAGALAN